MQRPKIFLFILAVLFGTFLKAQEVETTKTFTDCESETTYKDRMTCHNRAMNALILSKLNEQVATLQLNTGDTLRVSYDVKINEAGASELIKIRTENAPAENVIRDLVSGLEAVKPLQSSKGNPIAVSYGSNRSFRLNDNGLLEKLEWTKSEDTDKKGDVPFAVIENVPVYPGCKGSDNAKLKKCMSEKVSAFVGQHFDMKMVESLNLKPKRYRIAVQFKIDKKGNVVDVRSRADFPELEQEAVRVVSSLPQMVPGKQKGKEVGVLYALPILFEVQGLSEKELRKQQRKSRKKGR